MSVMRVLTKTGACALALTWLNTAEAQASGGIPTSQAAEDAQDHTSAEFTGLEEVVVVARKRAESLQSTPVPVTALSGQILGQQYPSALKDLTIPAPGVNLGRLSSFANAVSVYIRGIGNADNEATVDAPVGIFQDGIYVARPEGSSLDLFDVEQVEILRGPQGTLFGRNTTGGAILIRSKRPSGDNGTEGRITMGQYGRFDVRAAVEFPIVRDTLDARIGVMSSNLKGYYKNTFDGSRVGAESILLLRPILRFRPAEGIDWTLIGEYNRNHSDPTPQQNDSSRTQMLCANWGLCSVGPLGTIDEYKGNFGPDLGYIRDEVHGLTSDAQFDVGPGTIVWLSNYRKTNSDVFIDTDRSPANLFSTLRLNDHRQMSTELRFDSSKLGRLEFVAGLFAFEQKHSSLADVFQQFSPAAAQTQTRTTYRQKHQNLAAFTEVNYSITDRLRLTAGARLSWEKKEFSITPSSPLANPAARVKPEPARWTDFGPKLGMDYRVNDNVFVYANYSRGFKSGGFNGRAVNPQNVGPYGPEKVDNYEIGLKSDFLDRRLRANIAMFWADYADLQRTVIQAVPGAANPQQTLTLNAAAARVRGVEFELTALPITALRLDVSGSYLDAKYKSFCADLNGPSNYVATPTSSCGGAVFNLTSPGQTGPGRYLVDDDYSSLDLQRAPKWQLTTGATYTIDLKDSGTISLSSRYTHSSSTPTDVTNVPKARRAPLNLVDVSLTYFDAAARYSISVFGKNITNDVYLTSTSLVGALFDIRSVGEPRRWGVEFSWKL